MRGLMGLNMNALIVENAGEILTLKIKGKDPDLLNPLFNNNKELIDVSLLLVS